MRQAPPKAPVIQSNVDEVSIDLVARDKHGHALRDLRADEIQVMDDGHPARITSLRLITADGQPTPLSGETGRPHPFRLTSVVFDRLHSDANRIAARAAEYLFKEGAEKNLSFSVWRFSNRLELLQTFTDDQAALKRAVDSALKTSATGQTLPVGDPAQTLPPAPDPVRPFAEKQLTTAALSASISRDERVPPFVAGLLALIREQASIPGRKSIVYFSDGQQLASVTNPQFESIIGAANRAAVSIYSVDTSGVKEANDPNAGMFTMHGSGAPIAPPGPEGPPAGHAAPSASPQPIAGSLPTAPNLTGLAIGSQIRQFGHAEYDLPLRQIAEQTGGFYLSESNNVFNALRRVTDDLATYYEATYAPAKIDYDGHFRTVQVSVTRPRIVVQARAGYFSFPPNIGADLRPFELPLFKALAQPTRTERPPFAAEVFEFGQDENRAHAELAIELPLNGIAYQNDQNERLCKMHFSILAVVKAADGQIIQKMSEDLPLQTALENSEEVRQSIHTFQRSFTADPGSYKLDIAVLDLTDKRMSTASIPFNLLAQPRGLALSQLALVRRLEPIPQDSDPDDLLRYQGYRVVPNVRAKPEPGTSELPIFFTFYPNSKSSAKPSVGVELKREGAVIAKSALRLPDSRPGDPVPVVASFSKLSLPAGSYEMWATVTEEGVTRQQKLDFKITGERGSEQTPPSERAHATADAALGEDFLVEPKLLTGLQKPSDSQIERTIEAARQRAVDYKSALPNFSCKLITRRAIAKSAKAEWRQRDVVTQTLRYVDGSEDYHVIEVNGERPADMNQLTSKGVWSSGEFGQFLDAVFSPETGSHFEWQGFVDVNGTQTDAFRYHITRKRSLYALSIQNWKVSVAYHGFVYIDPNSMAVRRVSIEAEDIPQNFPIQESALTVDYKEFSVGGQQYVLPASATLYVREGKRHLSKNDKQFRDYRRYAGESTIKFN